MMMSMDEIITKTLNDKTFRNNLAVSVCGKDGHFECSDNKISENLFLLFINKCKRNKKLMDIFENIDYCLIVEKNITDAVFVELVKFATRRKKRANFVFLDLCHEVRNPEHMKYLRSLKFLNESFFY